MTKSRSRLEIWARSRSRRLRSRLHHCQVLLFFCVYGTVALRATADHYEKQHWSARNSYVPVVNNVQHRPTPLANHEMYRCHLCILNWALWRFLWKQWPNAIALALI